MLVGSGTKRVPNLVIAGAPKCATTSLFEWLSDHPDVAGSGVKETYFLMDSDSPLFVPEANFLEHGLRGYEMYFNEASLDKRYRVEATPDYLYQQTPLNALRQFPEPPRVIFVLRDPVQRAFSAYKFFTGHKSIFNTKPDFSQYVAALHGEDAPREHPLWPLVENTISYGEYASYLDDWASAIGKENLEIYLYEDLREDPRKFMQQVGSSLGIDSGFYGDYDFSSHNKSYDVKSIRLHRMKTRLAATMANSQLKAGLGKIYRRMNVRDFSDELSAADKAVFGELSQHYRQHNERLQKDFAVDTGRWCM